MHWTSIITALALSLISVYLVLIQGWTVTQRFLVVMAGALLLIAIVLSVLWQWSTPGERPELMRLIVSTMRNDFDEMLRWFRLKR